MARIDHYTNRCGGTTFFCTGCGEEFEPYATLLLDSRQRGAVRGNDSQWFNPHGYGQPYVPYERLQHWTEQHTGCVERAEVWETTERGVSVVDRRRVQ